MIIIYNILYNNKNKNLSIYFKHSTKKKNAYLDNDT